MQGFLKVKYSEQLGVPALILQSTVLIIAGEIRLIEKEYLFNFFYG